MNYIRNTLLDSQMRSNDTCGGDWRAVHPTVSFFLLEIQTASISWPLLTGSTVTRQILSSGIWAVISDITSGPGLGNSLTQPAQAHSSPAGWMLDPAQTAEPQGMGDP